MFCRECGKQIDNDSIVCEFCGYKTGKTLQQNYENQQHSPYTDFTCPLPKVENKAVEDDKVNVGLIILAVLVPFAGIILGAVFMNQGKRKSGKYYIIIGFVAFFLSILIYSGITLFSYYLFQRVITECIT